MYEKGLIGWLQQAIKGEPIALIHSNKDLFTKKNYMQRPAILSHDSYKLFINIVEWSILAMKFILRLWVAVGGDKVG